MEDVETRTQDSQPATLSQRKVKYTADVHDDDNDALVKCHYQSNTSCSY